ncbi:MAG: OmpA family protein, partial [Bacteroidota bacterium]
NVIESVSKLYDNLGIDQIRLQLFAQDSDNEDPVGFQIDVFSLPEGNLIYRSDSLDGTFPQVVRVPILGRFRFDIKAQKYKDTSFVFVHDTVVDYEMDQRFLMYPKRTEVSLSIRDLDTDEFLNLDALLKNQDRNEEIWLYPRDAVDGTYHVRVREEDEYEVEVKSNEGQIFFTNNILIPRQMKDKTLNVKVVTDLNLGAKIPLHNITFATRSSELNETAKRELDRVYDLIAYHKTAQLEIAAHTDNLGDPKFNQKLSFRRAQSVYEYLVKKGISGKRLVKKGYGSSDPIERNDTPEGRAANRRFELKVLKM